ncbi:MAG: CPBP family intramembrane glutamic endopeptidase [Steroidobacteraceae bacterium]
MRSFYRLVAMMAASLLAAAVLAYPGWLGVGLVAVQPFHRVLERIAMGVALVGLIWMLRHEKLGNREALGYTLPPPVFVRQVSVAFAAGLVLMLPLVAMLVGLSIRQVKPELVLHPLLLVRELGQGIFTGFAVAFIEETFFRGAMQTVMTKDRAPVLAILLPSLVYASVHFLGGELRVPPDQIHWASGFTVLANLFERFASPAVLLDSFAALFSVGILLALVRRHTGSIAACIGLHAGWVCVITTVRATTLHDPNADWAWLVGSYDAVIGWGAFGMIALLIAAYLTITTRTQAPRCLQVSQ